MVDAGAERRSAAGDLAGGVVLFAVSAVGAWSLSANRFIVAGSYGNDPGPGLLPAILLALLGLFSLAMIALAVARLLRLRGTRNNSRQPRDAWWTFLVPALLVVTLLFYAQSMTELGFLETTGTFAVFWTVAIGMQDTGWPDARRLAIWLLEGAAICAGIYAIFAWFIKIPLP